MHIEVGIEWGYLAQNTFLLELCWFIIVFYMPVVLGNLISPPLACTSSFLWFLTPSQVAYFKVIFLEILYNLDLCFMYLLKLKKCLHIHTSLTRFLENSGYLENNHNYLWLFEETMIDSFIKYQADRGLKKYSFIFLPHSECLSLFRVSSLSFVW